ncbi:carboxypeptidase-like regulatory domain-containing protein [[Eubacterium] hominis]|uniref:carboxypeptidase-like regulatory domain-containing protein n=1 Tax=[Eubacterium] hominis TaxID=2764325 RepID=UPI003A4D7C51
MKKIGSLLLLIGILCCQNGVVIMASEGIGTTEITTEVPETHHIDVIGEHVEVFEEGTLVKQITAKRLSTPKILLRSVSGYEIEQVMLGNVDITNQIKGGYYTFEPVYQNQELKVKTVQSMPMNQKLYRISGKVLKDAQPMSGVTVELRSSLQTQITDKHGSFTFERVDIGHHSITVLKDGTVIGYVEFQLLKGNSTKDVIVEVNENGSYTLSAHQSFDAIELNLRLNEDGTIVIETAKGVIDTKDSGVDTGDQSHVFNLFLMMGGAGILLLLIIHKGKIHKERP